MRMRVLVWKMAAISVFLDKYRWNRSRGYSVRAAFRKALWHVR